MTTIQGTALAKAENQEPPPWLQSTIYHGVYKEYMSMHVLLQQTTILKDEGYRQGGCHE